MPLSFCFITLLVLANAFKVQAKNPFASNITINVRRNTANGLPYGGTHSAGISTIVWGSASPNSNLTLRLTRTTGEIVTRTATTSADGSFSISMDRLIADGDVLRVSMNAETFVVPVPALTFQVNLATKVITGTAPAAITSITPGSPHSMQILLGETTRQVTTTADGSFSVSFADLPYLAGTLGAMRYTTPQGQNIYKPLFVVDPFARGKMGDAWADVILGQPDFSQITPNQVVGNRVFNPGGVYMDRSVRPNRVYIYDAGNSRVLGFSHLGYVKSGPNAGKPCTSNSDYPGATCVISATRSADIVLGQPSFSTSTCNEDSGYQLYPDVPMASAATLCGIREEQMSILETGTGASMMADPAGNLYVPDVMNNRVLRYNNPFTTDQIADEVWGQDDFSGITCNRGAGYGSQADSKSLCLAPPPGTGEDKAAVALDAAGNLWVTDNKNHRVLRFPFDSVLGKPRKEADLVLGQPDFRSSTSGAGLNQMNHPEGIRVASDNTVYVADRINNRILVFIPPFSNGMSAHHTIGTALNLPMSLEFDASGIWVSDASDKIVHYTNGNPDHTIQAPTNGNGIGVDSDGNVLFATPGYGQDVRRYTPPSYTQDAEFLDSDGTFNLTGSSGFSSGKGIEIANGQLIYADARRILFWNNAWDLHNNQPADGVIGQPDFNTRPLWGPIFERLRAKDGYLWALNSGDAGSAIIYAYSLPLKSGANPVVSLRSPLPLLGGGVFSWSESTYLGGIDFQPGCDCLWVADEDNNRVFRIHHPLTQPIVDIVLGQLNATGNACNQGRGQTSPSQNSLCHPGGLSFDSAGNLYLADHNLEFDGNHRLLEYDASTLPLNPTSTIFGIPATRVFGRNNDFTASQCLPSFLDPMCGPFEPAFDSFNRMMIGFNAYVGGPRFRMIYQDILSNPQPILALGDLQSMPTSNRFDTLGNLYVLDHNRNRILIYRNALANQIFLPIIRR
jgi:sugar lactone lactonase YvrE